MKKLFLMAFMAICAVSANAQLWIGGSLGYDYDSNYGGAKMHALTISPEVGYNLSEKWAIACNIDYNMAKIADGAMYDARYDVVLNTSACVHSFTINPYVRYTFAKAGIASFFVDGGFEGGFQKAEDLDATSIFGIGVQPGVALQISKKVCLVTKLGYLGYRHTDDRNQFGFGVNNETITFGAYYAF
ncbi:MAG: outer membrane beta-barrel protein [Bacteroidaceae bacterium]|nr:outer membrane beta-barrel protein [Bacteroidaceae bacterium]